MVGLWGGTGRPVFQKEHYLLCGGQVCAVAGSSKELGQSSLKEMMVILVKWGWVGQRSGQPGELQKVECNMTCQQRHPGFPLICSLKVPL